MNRVNSLGWSPATGYLSLGRSYSSPGVSYLFKWVVFSAVLRIHDILVRIRGSMPLTNGSGSGSWIGSCYFCYWPSRCQQKTNFFLSFSAYFFLKVNLHHFSKIKNQKRSQRTVGTVGLMIEGSGSVPLTNGSGSGSRRPKAYGWIR